MSDLNQRSDQGSWVMEKDQGYPGVKGFWFMLVLCWFMGVNHLQNKPRSSRSPRSIPQSLAGAPGLSQLRCHAARFTPGEAMTPTGHTTIGPGQGGSLGRFSWGLHPRKMLRGWQKPWFLYVFLGLYILVV